MVITLLRSLPSRVGWARDPRCRVLAGCYDTVAPNVREVYVREQVGVIEGWSYCDWEGRRPTAARLYVRVTM